MSKPIQSIEVTEEGANNICDLLEACQPVNDYVKKCFEQYVKEERHD